MTASVVFAMILSGLIDRCARAARDPRPRSDADLADDRDRARGLDRRRRCRQSISNDNGVVISFLSFGVAMALVAAYRRFVQQRPIFGPGALAFPERGLGVEQTRERLQKLGLDPNALRPDPAQLEQARLEAMLKELHRAGVLTDEEFADKLAGLQHPRTEN